MRKLVASGELLETFLLCMRVNSAFLAQVQSSEFTWARPSTSNRPRVRTKLQFLTAIFTILPTLPFHEGVLYPS